MNRLKELRQANKLTQSDLSEKLYVSLKTISRWENGESQIKSDKAKTLANFFGVSVGYLLGYTDNKKTYDDEYTLSIGDETYVFSDKRIQDERANKFLTEFILSLQNNDIFLSNSEILQIHDSILRLDANNENTLKGKAFIDGFTNSDSPYREAVAKEYSFIFSDFDNQNNK